MYWETRIKPVYDCSREWLDAVEIYTPALVLRNEISRELYIRETPAIIASIKKAVADQHEVASKWFDDYEDAEPTNEELSE